MTPSGELADRLAAALWPDRPAADYHTRAPVLSVEGSTVNVRLRGSTEPTPCSKLASCSPKAGDTALVLVMPAGCVVLGIIG